MQARLPHLHLQFSSAGGGHVPGSPLQSSPSTAGGASHGGGGPGFGVGAQLKSRRELGAGIELNPRVPRGARFPLPGRKEDPSGNSGSQAPQLLGAQLARILTITQGLWLFRSRTSLRRPLASARSSRLLQPPPCARGRLCNLSRDVSYYSPPRSAGAQERPLRSPQTVFEPRLYGSAFANPASSPQNSLLSISLPREKKAETQK